MLVKKWKSIATIEFARARTTGQRDNGDTTRMYWASSSLSGGLDAENRKHADLFLRSASVAVDRTRRDAEPFAERAGRRKDESNITHEKHTPPGAWHIQHGLATDLNSFNKNWTHPLVSGSFDSLPCGLRALVNATTAGRSVTSRQANLTWRQENHESVYARRKCVVN